MGVFFFSGIKDKVIEKRRRRRTKASKETGYQKTSGYNGLFQSGTRVAETRCLGYKRRTQIFGLTSVIKICCSEMARVRFKIFDVFSLKMFDQILRFKMIENVFL